MDEFHPPPRMARSPDRYPHATAHVSPHVAPPCVHSGNSDQVFEELGGEESTLVDAIWGKPIPSWQDGTMQKQLSELLAKRRQNSNSDRNST